MMQNLQKFSLPILKKYNEKPKDLPSDSSNSFCHLLSQNSLKLYPSKFSHSMPKIKCAKQLEDSEKLCTSLLRYIVYAAILALDTMAIV